MSLDFTKCIPGSTWFIKARHLDGSASKWMIGWRCGGGEWMTKTRVLSDRDVAEIGHQILNPDELAESTK